MKEEYRWRLLAGLGLVTLSLALYTVYSLVFGNARDAEINLLGNLAFVPIQVLVVTLIIEEMLASRDRQQRMEKLNMVVGIFFSRLGTPLLAMLSRADPGIAALKTMVGTGASTGAGPDPASRIKEVQEYFRNPAHGIGDGRLDRNALREYLVRQEDFLVRVVENPMVFEHETFTDLILAVTHLSEELKARPDLAGLPPADQAHLAGDIRRVYSLLVPEWIQYMEYLRINYPYLHSLAMRTNPFDENATVVIRQ